MDNWIWLIYGPAQLVERAPSIGFAIGSCALGVQLVRSLANREHLSRQWLRYPLVLSGLLWLLFTLYELQMIAVGMGLATTRLRLDLIVLTPILYGLSAFGIASLFSRAGSRAARPEESPSHDAAAETKSDEIVRDETRRD